MEPLTNQTIKQAIKDWCGGDKREVIKKYGHISKWDVSHVTNMSYLFNEKSDFTDDISKWNVSNVTNMSHMFCDAYKFNQPLENWNVSNVTDMSHMFCRTFEFNQSLENWNVSNVTNMLEMFWFAMEFNQPLHTWKPNCSNVTFSVYIYQKIYHYYSFAKYENESHLFNIMSCKQAFYRERYKLWTSLRNEIALHPLRLTSD